jgi:hypothetical protein
MFASEDSDEQAYNMAQDTTVQTFQASFVPRTLCPLSTRNHQSLGLDAFEHSCNLQPTTYLSTSFFLKSRFF